MKKFLLIVKKPFLISLRGILIKLSGLIKCIKLSTKYIYISAVFEINFKKMKLMDKLMFKEKLNTASKKILN